MIKGFDASTERYLADLGRIEDRQTRVQRELSSGLKVIRPSDAPDRVTNILELRSSIESATATQANLSRVRAEVDTAEAAVRVGVQLVERARVLAAEAATGTVTTREASEIEVGQLVAQLQSLYNTSSEGRLVFDAADRQIADVNGTRFDIGKSATDLFEAPGKSALGALQALQTALAANSGADVEAAIPSILSALDHLNGQLTFYGRTQNRVASATDLAKQVTLARTKELSEAQDADVTEALVTLNLTAVHQKTALAAHAGIPKTTLFDYLG